MYLILIISLLSSIASAADYTVGGSIGTFKSKIEFVDYGLGVVESSDIANVYAEALFPVSKKVKLGGRLKYTDYSSESDIGDISHSTALEFVASTDLSKDFSFKGIFGFTRYDVSGVIPAAESPSGSDVAFNNDIKGNRVTFDFIYNISDKIAADVAVLHENSGIKNVDLGIDVFRTKISGTAYSVGLNYKF